MKIQLRNLLVILGLIVGTTMAAQNPLETVDVIRTKAGSIWKGTITEITADGYYVVETLSGLTLRLHEASIINVRQEWANRSFQKRPYSFKEKGFYQTVELGLSGNSTGAGIGLTYSAGHRFSRWVGVGGGIGFEGYAMGWGRNVIPLFAEVRGFFTNKKVSPYYAVRAGYGFALTNDLNNITEAKGGYMFNPQLGLRFGGGSDVSFYMGAGVHFQQATYIREFPFSEQRDVDKYLFRRVEFKFGITF